MISGGAAPGNKADRYMELCEEVEAQLDELNRIRTEILHAIREVQDCTLATLLVEYYVNGKTWDQVAQCIHYSYIDTVKRKHLAALQAVEQVIQVDKKRYIIP